MNQGVFQTHVDIIYHTKMIDIEISIILAYIYVYSIIGHIMTFNEICNGHVL